MAGFEAVGFSLGYVLVDYSFGWVCAVSEMALLGFSCCECLRFFHELRRLLDTELARQPDA